VDRDTLKAQSEGEKCVADDPRSVKCVTAQQWQALARAAQQAAADFSKATPGGKLIRYKPSTRVVLGGWEHHALQCRGKAELRVMRIAFWFRLSTLALALLPIPIIFVVAPLRVAIPTLLILNALTTAASGYIERARAKRLALIDTTYRLGGFNGAPV
jgi:hypothetical protein